MSRHRAVLVEDHALTRTLLTSMLESMGFYAVAAESVDEAMDLIQKLDPVLVITDLDLGPGPTGVELAAWTQRRFPKIGIVLLTAHRSTLLVDAKELPPSQRRVHLIKEDITSPDILYSAIRVALQIDDTKLPDPASSADYTLSRDQADVLRLMSQGHSNAEIAKQRDTSVSAVENIARRIYSALDLAGDESINPRSAAISLYQQSEISVQ